LELLIPESYVSNISERLSLYSQLDNIKDEPELKKFTEGMVDRFGPMPDPVKDLIETVRLRWIAEKLGFEKLTLKNDTMKCYFIPSDNEAYYKSETFGNILKFVQLHSKKCKMRELKNKLILSVEEVSGVQEAIQILTNMQLQAVDK